MDLFEHGLKLSSSKSKHTILHKKRSFPLRISVVNETKSADLDTFTEEILNGKLCEVIIKFHD